MQIRSVLLRKAMRAAWRMTRKILLSGVLLSFLGLSLLGFLVGRGEVTQSLTVPLGELFDNLQVYSYRVTPSDTSYHFVVELSAFGKPFAESGGSHADDGPEGDGIGAAKLVERIRKLRIL